MTYFDIDVSINDVNFQVRNVIRFEFRVVKKMGEVKSTYSFNHGVSFESRDNFRCEMTRLNTDLFAAANYLILLFFRTGQRYTCTRTKIGKLLTIVAFTYAVENQLLFNENIYRYGECGTAINEILDKYERDIYISDPSNDDELFVTHKFNSLCDLDESIQREFDIVENLDISIMRRIDDVFMRFGSYSGPRLGECINTIINCDGITNNDGTVNFDKIYELSCDKKRLNDISDSKTNLLRYVFKL